MKHEFLLSSYGTFYEPMYRLTGKENQIFEKKLGYKKNTVFIVIVGKKLNQKVTLDVTN